MDCDSITRIARADLEVLLVIEDATNRRPKVSGDLLDQATAASRKQFHHHQA